ncbi:hypothetical protein EKK97_14405 [Billgrantia tianxiuensis]|uniref:Uncharacterized protein n=1 Tax=Billgrantia tianxiuensis TaxID=2497861 RepID=A0A6I6SS58_9GAMM|nr:hypothetical protein [Halomonas tianxiuensis]QHC50550.1 hypothetical protein EKK97_14405 [Halomonas tianxiuensis]
MRKLLRGKTVSPNRLAESCLQWHSAPVGQREAWLGDLRATFNTALPDRVQAILSGRRITGFVRATFLLRAGWASLRDGGVPLAFRRRRRFVLGLRHRVLLKRPVAPVLFEVSGEEAAMLAAHIEMVLAGMGVTTQRVASVAVGPAALWRRGGG